MLKNKRMNVQNNENKQLEEQKNQQANKRKRSTK